MAGKYASCLLEARQKSVIGGGRVAGQQADDLLHLGASNPAACSVFDNGCVDVCDVTTCSCTAAAYYWSPSAYLANPEGVWIVGFDYGNTLAFFKGNAHRARAVRGGS